MSTLYTRLQSIGFFAYGKVVPGLMLYGTPAPYPMVNERAVRAGAGITFVLGGFAFFQALFLAQFVYLQIVVVLFFFDFLMKTVVGLRFSPISFAGDLLVRNQTPEYVGAVQKRFAWSLGLVLASAMMLLLFVFDVRGIVNLTICSLCLVFMWLETSVGVCVGCKIYGVLLKHNVVKTPEHRPVCPGNVCSID